MHPRYIHAYFGVCGISLIGQDSQYVKPLNAKFGLAADTVRRTNLRIRFSKVNIKNNFLILYIYDMIYIW